MSLSRAQRQRIERIARGRGDEPLFLLEGRRAVRDALAARSVAELWLSEDLDPKQRAELAALASEQAVPCETARPAEMDRLGKTVSPQGVIALVRDTSDPLDSVAQRPGWLLWIDGLQDPGNVGAAVRVAVAFGAAGLLVSEGGAHPLGLKALRASAGLALRIPFARAHPEKIRLALPGTRHPVWMLEREGEDVFAVRDVPPSFVLVVGAEGAGPSEAAQMACRRRLGVRIDPRVDSLNAAVAAGIAAAALTRREVRKRG